MSRWRLYVERRAESIPGGRANHQNYKGESLMRRCGVFLASAGLLLPAMATACPFCTTLQPTIAQQCDGADVAFLGELAEANGTSGKLRILRPLQPAAPDRQAVADISLTASGDDRPRRGSLLLAVGKRQPAGSCSRSWTTVELNEASYAYIAQSPPLNQPADKRLAYFARFLEHADPLIAEDAYLEFGHAPFDQVARVAGRLDVDRLRGWLDDETVSPRRKGLYGLLLGIAAAEQRRAEVAGDFRRWIAAPANDFRSGFDGILGGYLWLGKEQALHELTERFLDNRDAAIGDLRHWMTALRFYRSFGRDIPTDELTKAYRRFLERPALAAAAIGDLARWHDWQSLDQVTTLFSRPGYTDAATHRAIVGYLLACPLPEAARQVARLRQLVPERVAEAERLEASTRGTAP